jgi:hypothetical protein
VDVAKDVEGGPQGADGIAQRRASAVGAAKEAPEHVLVQSAVGRTMGHQHVDAPCPAQRGPHVPPRIGPIDKSIMLPGRLFKTRGKKRKKEKEGEKSKKEKDKR